MRQFIEEDGPAPDEIIEARLVSEFGWTLDEIDEQDEARALRLLAARNIEAAARAVEHAVAQHQMNTVPEETWALWNLLHNSRTDD